MNLFEQLDNIDQWAEEAEEKRKQEQLFNDDQENAMGFLVDDIIWQEIELEKAQEAEKQKLKPLSAGFGPWAW